MKVLSALPCCLLHTALESKFDFHENGKWQNTISEFVCGVDGGVRIMSAGRGPTMTTDSIEARDRWTITGSLRFGGMK